jgi:sulfite exporter TauE/SafE
MALINLGTAALSFGHCKSPCGGLDVRASILLSHTRDCTRIGWRSLAILYTLEGKAPSSRR